MIATKTKLLATVALVAGFLYSFSLYAEEGRVLLLTGDSALEDHVLESLPGGLSVQTTGIEIDYESETFITDEGNRIRFIEFLHGRSLRSSKALRQLQLEYGTDYVVMAWIDEEKIEKYTAYDLNKITVTARVRVVDAVTGKSIADDSSSHTTEWSLEGSDEDQAKARKDAIKIAAAEIDRDQLLTAINQHYASKQATQDRIRIVFQNISQDDYFKHRDAILALVTQAGAMGELRDDYEQSKQEFTVRVSVSSDLESFYRSLYASSLDSEAFDHFEISHDQKSILVKVLPPERKRIVIAGITPENYHTRLETYRESIVSQSGVKELGFEYLTDSGTAGPQLVFTFTYGDDLTALEEKIWLSLKEHGETPNRALLSINDQAIHYRAGPVAGDRIAFTITVNNVAPGDYRKIGTPLDQIIKGLSIQELRKEYNREDYRLTYRFNTIATASELDSILWDQIAANDALGDVVQDTTSENNLGYFYFQKRPVTRHIVISIRTLSPENYRTAGRSLINIIKAVEGVGRVQRSYSATNQTLVLRFQLKGNNAYAVDAAIWEATAKDDSLQDLAMGELDEDELEYFFGGAVDASQRDVIIHLKQVSGQKYKNVATQFSDMLRRIKDVQNVRYRYLLNKKTVVFRLQYGGEGLFALDDALQRSMVANKLFEHASKGSERLGRLVYIFASEPTESVEEERPTWTGEKYATGDIIEDQLTKLDQTVVYLYVSSDEGDSEGTGFFISAAGHILTNAHVVEGGYVYVRLYDGTQYTARIIKTDLQLDLALLRIESAPRKFTKATIGNSEQINRGDPITVIGHPLGARFEYSVLTGILSGHNREHGFLQLSIPSYPGISGAPVFDAKGRVVGVMAAVAMAPKHQLVEIEQQLTEISTISTVENIGLAIPINYARNIIALASP